MGTAAFCVRADEQNMGRAWPKSEIRSDGLPVGVPIESLARCSLKQWRHIAGGRVQRKLAADAVGYSRLMERGEAGGGLL